MIKNIAIRNFKGIKQVDIDFKQKHISYHPDQADQILKHDEEYVSLIPTLLAKNATGKTSLLSAIDFALSLVDKDKLEQRLYNCAFKCAMQQLQQTIRRSGESNNNDEMFFDTAEIQQINPIKSEIVRVHNSISHAGTNETTIIMEMLDNTKLVIEITSEHFNFTLNNQKFDFVKLLADILDKIEINSDTTRALDISRILQERVKNVIKNIKFPSHINLGTFYGSESSTNSECKHGVFIKHHIVEKYVNDIITAFGFEAASLLLKKVDRNIKKIAFDKESKTFSIFLKTSDMPIVTRNLSFGTQKVIEIIAKSLPIFADGGVMIVDEIENGLHLSLVKLIVSLYENEKINLGQGQLILTTHTPLLFERDIITTRNAYIYDDNKFMTVKSLPFLNKRTYTLEQSLKAKNYFNDLFWMENNLDSKSTLSDVSINQIINELSEVKWPKK